MPDDTIVFDCQDCGTEYPISHAILDDVLVSGNPVVQHSPAVCIDCIAQHYRQRYTGAAAVPLVYEIDPVTVYLEDAERYVSRRWARENAHYHEECDRWYEEELHFNYAYDAWQAEHGSDRPTYSYHEVNVIDVQGWPSVTPKSSLAFGVELEMEHRDGNDGSQDDMSDALGGRDGNGTYILMSDGSLSDSGVELITLPYTLDYHQSKFHWNIVLEPVTRIGRSGQGTTNCGMHVHASRAAISPLTLGKLLVFINSSQNRALVNRVAQRTENGYCQKHPKKVTHGLEEASGRYEALHVAKHTVEFRLFRGNLRYERVLKNIEFCHASIIYCQDASITAVEEPTGFIAWLSKRRKTYPNLVRYLQDTNMLTSTAIVSEDI